MSPKKNTFARQLFERLNIFPSYSYLSAASASSTASTSSFWDSHDEAKEITLNDNNTIRSKRRKRKYKVKRCSVESCKNGARSKGLCKGHGGGKRCQHPSCDASDQGGGFCISHGGGRRCTVEGCKNGVQSRGLCKHHGGGRRCIISGCTKSSQGENLCRAHGGGKRCLREGCQNIGTKHRKGLCKAHSPGRTVLKKQTNHFNLNEKAKILTEECDDMMRLLQNTPDVMAWTELEDDVTLKLPCPQNIDMSLGMFSMQENIEMAVALQDVLSDDMPFLDVINSTMPILGNDSMKIENLLLT